MNSLRSHKPGKPIHYKAITAPGRVKATKGDKTLGGGKPDGHDVREEVIGCVVRTVLKLGGESVARRYGLPGGTFDLLWLNETDVEPQTHPCDNGEATDDDD